MEMDAVAKKRKPDESSAADVDAGGGEALGLTREDVLQLVETLSRDELAGVVASATLASAAALDAVRAAADGDPNLRRLFVHDLDRETTSDTLHAVFSSYGELLEAVVIKDKVTGGSRRFGFVTFRHADSALLALKVPEKRIDGRLTVTQFAGPVKADAPFGEGAAPADFSHRKILVRNVPDDMPPDRLLAHFAKYGKIKDGPLGWSTKSRKFHGFALFVYRTPEGAQAALADPVKVIDGHQFLCRLATEDKDKKGKQKQPQPPEPPVPAGPQPPQLPHDMPGAGLELSAQCGGPGSALSSFASLATAVTGAGAGMSVHNPYLNFAAAGAAGLGSLGSQVPSNLGTTGAATGAGMGGPYANFAAGSAARLGSLGSQVPSNLGSAGAAAGAGAGAGARMVGHNAYANLAAGGVARLVSLGSQVPSNLGTARAGASGSGGLGVGLYRGSLRSSSSALGDYGGLGMGGASSLYRMPEGLGMLTSGGYGDGSSYLLTRSAFQGQDLQQAGMSPGSDSRATPEYPSVPPYL